MAYERHFSLLMWTLTAAASVALAFIALNPLVIRGLRLRRSRLAAEAVFLDIPIVAPLCALGSAGIAAAALAYAVGFGAASMLRRPAVPTDIARHGTLRTIVTLVFAALATRFHVVETEPKATLLFAFALALAFAGYTFVLSGPVTALAYRVSVRRVWDRLLRDPRTWLVGVGSVFWAVCVRVPLLDNLIVLAIAMWFPVLIVSHLVRTIDAQHAELHRLRLVRDAVQAMLGDRDPLPQISGILATLSVPSPDETVTVVAATRGRLGPWRNVTKLGPELSPAGDEVAQRVQARLKFSGRATVTLREEFYIGYGFAARSSDGELHGALIVHRRPDHPMTREARRQFANAARELAPLLRDMRSITAAQNAATVDALTGLYNRAFTVERLQMMIDERLVSENGAVLILDIDHFKTINDRLGHAAGDECLRRIGEIIRHAVRSGDTAGRIGGEEFLIVMPGASREIALTVGERLRLAVALGGMRYADGAPVTASIGVASANAGDTAETLLARADRGLYEAKRQGRNRIVETEESA